MKMLTKTLMTLAILLGFASSLLAEPALLWTREYGKRSVEELKGLAHLPGEGYFMVGCSNYRITLDGFDRSLCIMYADEDLQYQWTRTIPIGGESASYPSVFDSFIDEDGNAGFIVELSGELIENGVWLIRYSAEGDSLPAVRLGERNQTKSALFLSSGNLALLSNDHREASMVIVNLSGDTLDVFHLGNLISDWGYLCLQEADDGSFWIFQDCDNSATLNITQIGSEGDIFGWTELAETWIRGEGPIMLEDGGAVICTNFGFTKVDADLDVVYTTLFDYGMTGVMTALPDNEIMALMRVYDEQGDHFSALRLNSSGEIVSHQDNSNILICFQALPDGNDRFVAAGQFASEWGYWKPDFVLTRLDFDGNVVDTTQFGNPDIDEEYPAALVINASGDHFVALSQGSIIPELSPLQVMKISANGDSLTTRDYDPGAHECANNMIPTRDNGFLLMGRSYFFNPAPYQTTAINARFLRLDENLDTLWTLSYSPQQVNYFDYAIETMDGGFLATGSVYDYNAEERFSELIKISADGQIVDTRRWGDYILDEIRPAMDGNYMVEMTQTVDDQYYPGFAVIDEDMNFILTNQDSLDLPGSWIYDCMCDPDFGYILIGANSDHFPAYFRFDWEGHLINSYVHARHPFREFVKILPYNNDLNLIFDNFGSIYVVYSDGTEFSFYDYREHNDWYDVTAQLVDVQFFPATPPYRTITFLGESYSNDVYMTKAEMWPMEITSDKTPFLPDKICLSPAYPNPFNAVSRMSYSLPKQSTVTLTIFDAQGRCVALLDEGVKAAGEHQVTINASSLSTGVYVSRLEAAGVVCSSKLVVLR